MKNKEYLFAYGSLRPSEEPPTTMSDPKRDWVEGDEIQFENRHKKHWAEVEYKDGREHIKGYSMLIDASELPALDKREAPDYRRVKVQTYNGHDAWSYEYEPNKYRTSIPGWKVRHLAIE